MHFMRVHFFLILGLSLSLSSLSECALIHEYIIRDQEFNELVLHYLLYLAGGKSSIYTNTNVFSVCACVCEQVLVLRRENVKEYLISSSISVLRGFSFMWATDIAFLLIHSCILSFYQSAVSFLYLLMYVYKLLSFLYVNLFYNNVIPCFTIICFFLHLRMIKTMLIYIFYCICTDNTMFCFF